MLILYLNALNTQEEKDKFEQIYNQYKNLMKYVAMEILKDEYLAEDAVHSAFEKIIDKIDCIDDIESVKTRHFLVIVTKNTAKDMYVKRKKENSIEIVEFSESAEELSIINFELESIVSAIHKLPDLYCDVIVLKYLYEYEDKEIADLLSIKKSAVRKRLERAKKKLYALLQKECD